MNREPTLGSKQTILSRGDLIGPMLNFYATRPSKYRNSLSLEMLWQWLEKRDLGFRELLESAEVTNSQPGSNSCPGKFQRVMNGRALGDQQPSITPPDVTQPASADGQTLNPR